MTRSLSSIIKGRRIRSESTLEIEGQVKPTSAEEIIDQLMNDKEDQKVNIEQKLHNANSQAERLIQAATEEARAKATMIIKEGQDRIKMESFIALEKANEKGYTSGYEKGQLEAQGLVHEGKRIVVAAKEQQQEALDELEPAIIELVLKICGKLIDEEVNYNKDTILILIRKTLQKVGSDTSDITIKVSESDYPYVMENKELIMGNTSKSEKIKIVEDLDLKRGSCIIETEFGSIECNVDEAFLEIKKQMRLLANKK